MKDLIDTTRYKLLSKSIQFTMGLFIFKKTSSFIFVRIVEYILKLRVSMISKFFMY